MTLSRGVIHSSSGFMGRRKKKSKGLAVYRMVMPQSYCSLQNGFYLQPIILEFSFSQYIPLDKTKPAFVFPRWKKGENKKVRHPDGSIREYPVLAFYICVNRDLAHKGTFRQAHHAVGEIVAKAEKMGKKLNELDREKLLSINERLGRDAQDVFDLESAMARRNIIGAPGTREVAKQLAKWRKTL